MSMTISRRTMIGGTLSALALNHRKLWGAPIDRAPVGQQLAQQPPQAPSKPTTLSLPRIPATAATLALAASKGLPPALQVQRFYIWCPNGTKEEAAIARFCLNIAVSHSPVDYNPPAIAGGALVPVDLLALCPDAKDFDHALIVWHNLSLIEPYFHATIFVDKNELEESEPYIQDGRRYTQRWVKRHSRFTIPAPHIGKAGLELEAMAGNKFPDQQSYCPIVRLDWFVWASLSSIDGAQYLNFRGLRPFDPNKPESKENSKKDATKLNDYLKQRGVDEQFIKAANADQRAALMSHVTGRARGINFEQTSLVKPDRGQGIVAVTDDNFYDRDDVGHSPFYSLLDHKPDAHEVILTLPSGWNEYTLWDGDGTLLTEAVSRVVTDSSVPDPFPKRLNGAISCVRCHGLNEGWQPATNEVKAMLADRVRILTDLSHMSNEIANLTRLASLYTGEIQPAIKAARDTMDRRCFAVSGLGAKPLMKLTSDYYNQYIDWVSPKIACAEIGIVPTDPTGAVTFRRAIPPRNATGLLPDDPTFGRLSTDYLDLETNQRTPLNVTRREWELVYADAMDRALAQVNGAKKGDDK